MTGQKKGNREIGKTGKLEGKTGPSKKRSREPQEQKPTEQIPQETPAQTVTRSTLKRRREQRAKTIKDETTKDTIKIRSTLKRRRVQQLQDTRSTLKRRRKQAQQHPPITTSAPRHGWPATLPVSTREDGQPTELEGHWHGSPPRPHYPAHHQVLVDRGVGEEGEA